MDSTLIQSAVLPLASGLTLCNDGLVRPAWASHDELLRSYYDTEWGLPVHDEAGVFERLVLEGFQAGLSWRTVLAKREAFRAAFEGFIPDRVAAFTSDDVDRLVYTPGIIHNRRKIEAAISNARATVAMRNDSPAADGPSHLGELVWSYRPTSIRFRVRRTRYQRSCRNPLPSPPTSRTAVIASWVQQRCSH